MARELTLQNALARNTEMKLDLCMQIGTAHFLASDCANIYNSKHQSMMVFKKVLNQT